MADMRWRWNGSAWVEYTGGGGGAITYHTHPIDQITSLSAELADLDTRITALTGSDSPALAAAVAELTAASEAQSDRIALIEQLGANMVAIAGATSARVNQVNGEALHPDSVVVWFTDGSDAVNALNGDGIYNRAPL